MNSCETIRELLVLHADGALEPAEARPVVEHMALCAACCAEAEQVARLRGLLTESDLFEPAQDLAWQLLPEKLAVQVGTPENRRAKWGILRSPRWIWSAAAVLVLACGLILALRYQTPAPLVTRPASAAAGNEAFLGKVRAVYAREATAQYLAGCRNLLMDLVSADRSCEGNMYNVSLEVAQARRLLQQKRILDPDLRIPEVERARDLCDELEGFLVNLSSSQECETSDSIRSMERYIQNEQLLLRINLVQSGIS